MANDWHPQHHQSSSIINHHSAAAEDEEEKKKKTASVSSSASEMVEDKEQYNKNNKQQSRIGSHIETCTNIKCPWWWDWGWGGLNFHIEHHMMPRLAREYYREVSGLYVRPFCAR